MKKLVIFDLDGTILNTIKDLTNSVNYVLKHYNMPLKKEEEIKYYLGYGPKYLLEKAFNKTFSEKEYQAVYSLYDNYYSKHQLDFTKAYDGIDIVLKDLKESGYLIAVCSNKQESAVKELMTTLFPNTFDIVMGTSSKFLPKPEPDMVLNILDELEVKKENTIYIGDTQVDMQTAINAKIKKIAVLYGFRKKTDLEFYNPEYYVNTPSELTRIIKEVL